MPEPTAIDGTSDAFQRRRCAFYAKEHCHADSRHALNKGITRQLRLLQHRLFLDVGGDHRDTVFVAGAARSGTTWLSNILNYDNTYRQMFEPFNTSFVAEARPLRRRQYLPANAPGEAFIEGIGRILSGRVRNPWIDRHNRRIVCERRIVKEVAGNLLLGWIRQHFPGMPIVLIMRHPCAVARSRSRLWPNGMTTEWVEQFDLIADHLLPFMDLISAPLSPFERHVVDWCVEHYVPLRMLGADDICVVFYEELCVDPDAALRRIGDYLGRTFAVPERILAAPSRMARRTNSGFASAILTGASLIDDWRRHVSPTETRRAVDILNLFGLDRIYTGSSMPRNERVFAAPAASEHVHH